VTNPSPRDSAPVDAPLVTVSFTLPDSVHADSASVVGDFNDWDPEQGTMQRDDSGTFTCQLSIAPGRTYQYRFLLDGDRWTNDWSAHAYAPNSFGGEDSVLDLTDHSMDGDVTRTELEEQRDLHQPADAGATERADDGMAPLINNTGDDGGAASG
jgi:1,4-alpha-glucan branching enzyme